MSKIQQLIVELKDLKKESNHKSALHIYRLMENNKRVFLDKMDANDFNFIHSNFESLSYGNPKEYNTPSFIRDYEKYFESLMFHLNKIV
ncbi:MAG: hypothetical protein Q7W45_02970 [Bacteroidota bacterium]|nr:hypothetical protein [Bacteroidota bacterium]MDP3145783.1 hypothetical protein [Bacteroidota bacterium]